MPNGLLARRVSRDLRDRKVHLSETWNHMLTDIAMIFKKELIYTLRDRKTLIFMALIPTLAVPVFLIGINRVMRSALRKQGVQEVTIAADAQTHETYRRWIHEWMLDTDVAAGLRVLTSPIMKALIKPEMIGTFGDIPSDILTDPSAFESWIRGITQNVRQGLDTVERRCAERRRCHISQAPWRSLHGDFG